jgi:hypothetical protein
LSSRGCIFFSFGLDNEQVGHLLCSTLKILLEAGETVELKLFDPVYQAIEKPSDLERLGMALILDKRDLPFLKLMVLLLMTVLPCAITLYLMRDLKWWVSLGYWSLCLGYFLGPYTLMLHNTSHRSLFRAQYAWMGHIIPWVIGPFFGQTPESYFSHHVGMHHVQSNLQDDLSSTMRYQRDSFLSFICYSVKFLLFGAPLLLIYLKKKKRTKLFRNVLIGEASFYVITFLLYLIHWKATLTVLIVPLIFTRLSMMAGNWAQHAFIDENEPENFYKNSITCINSTYNRRCFNDGYHIGHHIKSNRHWTEMPRDFADNLTQYEKNGAIVFQGVDYFAIWLSLMFKRYDWLADHFVPLKDQNMSRDEIAKLLRARTKRIPESPLPDLCAEASS